MLLKFQPPAEANESVRILHDWTLWFCKPSGLNDPYENLPEMRSIRRSQFDSYIESICGRHIRQTSFGRTLSRWSTEYRLRLRQIQDFHWQFQNETYIDDPQTYLRAITDCYGVFCAAELAHPYGEDAALMWAHYGKNHTGIAIEFNPLHRIFRANETDTEVGDKNVLLPGSDLDGLMPVKYTSQRPKLSPLISHPSIVHACLLSKSQVWRYEKERRCIKFLMNATMEGRRRINSSEKGLLVTGDPSMVRAVYLGANCSEAMKGAVDKALNQPGTGHIEILTLGLAPRRYELRIEHIRQPSPQDRPV